MQTEKGNIKFKIKTKYENSPVRGCAPSIRQHQNLVNRKSPNQRFRITSSKHHSFVGIDGERFAS